MTSPDEARELAERLAERYGGEWHCPVCAKPLTVASIGGNEPTKWACTNVWGRSEPHFDADHYDKSARYGSGPENDPDVIAAVIALRSLAREVEALTKVADLARNDYEREPYVTYPPKYAAHHAQVRDALSALNTEEPTEDRPAEPTVQKPRKPHYELLTKEQQDWLDAATPAEPTVQEEKP